MGDVKLPPDWGGVPENMEIGEAIVEMGVLSAVGCGTILECVRRLLVTAAKLSLSCVLHGRVMQTTVPCPNPFEDILISPDNNRTILAVVARPRLTPASLSGVFATLITSRKSSSSRICSKSMKMLSSCSSVSPTPLSFIVILIDESMSVADR